MAIMSFLAARLHQTEQCPDFFPHQASWMSKQSIIRPLGGLARDAHTEIAVGHKALSRWLTVAENYFRGTSSSLPLGKYLSLLDIPSMSKCVTKLFVEFRVQSTYVFN